MDWSRVKNILIILFIALNIFLFVNIINISVSDNVSKKTLNNTVKILNSNNVALDCKIPTYSKDTGTPEFEENVLSRGIILGKLMGNIQLPSLDATQDGNLIESNGKWIVFNGNGFEYGNSNPDGNININSIDDIVKNIKLMLKDTQIPLGGFKPDYPEIKKLDEGKVMVTLREQKDGIIIFDNRITVVATEKGIISMALDYRKLVDITQPRKIIPAYQILIRNFHRKSGTTITSIDFGFKETPLDNEPARFVDVPVWRIMNQEGQAEFYRADNGEQIE
ncbi:MAG TPA: hypothetical protein GXX49_01525 [Clostridiaceae bacterium]|jgi:regulatory protein YycI of two-component signal transduction system YycFG|nr:hypothetical protein [Clostridiaceae bacterium]